MSWLRSGLEGWRLSTRIVVLSLVLLLLVQAVGFGVVRAAIESNARNQIARDLAQDERIWLRRLEQNAERLRQGALLLSTDYGFRSAVASRDLGTIRSALENSGARIGANVTALLDPDLSLRAIGTGDNSELMRYSMVDMAVPLSKSPNSSRMMLVGELPYQFVMVPIRAPLVVGWVMMGFPLDKALIDDIATLLDVQVAVLTSSSGSNEKLVASTLSERSVEGLQIRGRKTQELTTEKGLLLARRVDMDATGGKIHTLLLRSVDGVVAPFRQLQVILAFITALGVLLFGIGMAWAMRRVTTPLRSVIAATERIGRGEYDASMLHLNRHDEIGELARAFDRMRLSIAGQQDEIRRLAYWDRLTGLPNRIQFREAVQQAIEHHRASNVSLAVITLDLDRFKHVNDTLGYAVGDQLLQGVAKRLLDEVSRSDDLVARLGGNEFALLLPFEDAQGAWIVAQQIVLAFEIPLSLAEQTVDLSAGIGIACWPAHASDADALLSRSEIAMYAAKRRTTGVQLYDTALDSSSTQTLSLLTELRHAVEHGELRLYLQPKIALTESRVVGAEALVRWQHPSRGLVPPMDFIPFAEQTGFVRQLTLWMMAEAARTWPFLQREGQALRISVNLSTRDLLDQDFPARLSALLARYNVPASAFCLEITESAIMDDPQRAEATLNRLSALGFKLSIDDFGTGYSSLAYLKRLPVDELKIDKSFVMGMEKDEDDAKIVRSTIDLAHNLGLTVVAEGIENETVYNRLRALDCDEAQGYYMSRPVPVDQFVVWRAGWEKQPRATEVLPPPTPAALIDALQ